MTTTNQVKCPKCPQTFEHQEYGAFHNHMRQQHPTSGQKAAVTRAHNQKVKDEAKKAAESRMAAASTPVIERTSYRKGHVQYTMRLSYQVNFNEYTAPNLRVPTSGALLDIKSAEGGVQLAQERLAHVMQQAFQEGAPLTAQDIAAARAAGEEI